MVALGWTLRRLPPRARALSDTLRIGAIAIALLTTAGCQSKDPNEGRVWQTGEVLDGSPLLSTEKILSIGDSTTGDTRFTRISDLAVDQAGRIYTVESYIDACARIFDAHGRFLQKLGGHGQGPGECRGTAAIALAGDSVFVYDRVNLLVFADGRYARSVRVHGRDLSNVDKLQETDAGLMAVMSGIQPGEKRIHVHVRPIDRATGDAGPPLISIQLQEMYLVGGGYSAAPLSATPTVAMTQGGGALFTKADSFAIDVVSRDGNHGQFVAIDVPRVSVTADALENARSSMGQEFERGSSRKKIESIPVPEPRPVIGQIVTSSTDLVAVRRRDLEHPGSPTSWVLLADNGEVIGRFELPPRFRAYALTGCLITGVALRQDTDEPIVMQYRINAPSPHCEPAEATT